MKSRLLVVLLFSAVLASAQSFRGGIQGVVTDNTGAVISGADVAAVSAETGLKRTTQSDASGAYFISELPIGTYSVSGTKTGFSPQTVKGVTVTVSASQQVNLQLVPGSVAQTVNVNEESPMLQTTQDTLGATLEAKQFQDMPVSGRDFTKLLVMVPGSQGDAAGVSDSPGSFGLFSINGQRGRSNNYLLDGTDMNDGYRNLPAINQGGVFGTPATILPIDALEEIAVLNGTEAEFGRSAGGTVNIVTKSGTNEFHTSVYEYFRNNGLDARNAFNPTSQPQDVFHNNQFGVSAGGPFVKNKTFWFVSYEGQREGVGIPLLARVPTQAELNQAIADNGGVVNPVIANLLARNPWGAPNVPADANGNNLQTSSKASNRVDSLIAKIDQHFSANDILTGRYYYGSSDQSFPFALVGGGVLPGSNTVTPTDVNILSLSYTHVFTPRLLTEVRGGFNRFHEDFFPQDHSFDPSTIGLNMGTGAQDFGLPTISVGAATGHAYAKLGASTGDPRGRVDINTQFFNNYTWTTGRHNWKFGYEFRRTSVDGFLDNGYRGTLSFSNLDNFIAGTPSSGRQAQGISNRQTFQNSHSFYAQDDLRLTKRLSLNFGVRWDYYGVIGEDQNRFSILNSTGAVQQVNQLYPRDLNNFAPRFGIAWDVFGTGKTVVRSGWGLYYDGFPQDLFVGQLPFNTFNAGPAYNGIGPDPITFSFSPAAILQPGVRVFDPSTFGATDVFTVDQKLRTPYVQVYNLTFEQQFGQHAALEVGYVGSQGRKLFRFVDLNQANPSTGTVAFPTLGFVNQIQTSASSSYNSLQASLRFRNWHGFNSSLNYTWSHSIDNASDGQDFVPNASQPDNSFVPRAERASSNFDMRQHLSWSFSYAFPEVQRLHWLSSGWNANGVLALSAGQPFNLNYLFEGNYNGSGEFFGRPDVVGNPFAGTSGPGQFLNLSAFQVPCTLNGGGNCIAGTEHFGNVGRNAFVGPTYKNFDFGLSKTSNLGESVKMQFGFDVFNLFNHANFASPIWPSFAVDFLQNGISPTGRGVGFLPLTATSDVGAGNPFLGGGGPRNLQLSLRFTY